MRASQIDPPRVLVVEDDEKLAALLCRALCADGFDASAASDGVVALGRLSAEPFAAVVLDVGLPGLDGLGVCAQLRADGSAIPVLMLSARDAVEDVLAGLRAGATDYLVKPFSLDDLEMRLREALDDGLSATAQWSAAR